MYFFKPVSECGKQNDAEASTKGDYPKGDKLSVGYAN